MTTFRAAVSSTGSGTSRPWNHSYPSSGCFSEYLFYDESGHAHTVLQAEGGEQGDPLMPGLFAVGIHRALRAAHSALSLGEDLFAFLDGTYITCPVERVVPTFRALRSALAEYANIDLHLGKTWVWNAAGLEPEGLAAEVPPQPGRPPVWVGAHSLPAEQQGMVVLGTPLGTFEHYQKHSRTFSNTWHHPEILSALHPQIIEHLRTRGSTPEAPGIHMSALKQSGTSRCLSHLAKSLEQFRTGSC